MDGIELYDENTLSSLELTERAIAALDDSPDRQDKLDYMLTLAVDYAADEVVERIIRAGDFIGSYREDNGDMAIHRACVHDRLFILRQLVERMEAHGIGFEHENAHGETPQHRAAANNSVRCLRYFANKGARMSAVDGGCVTPLMDACRTGSVEAARFLIETCKAPLVMPDADEATSFLCRYCGHPGIARVLLAAGVEVDAPDNTEETALFVAVRLNNADSLVLLLEAGADPYHENQYGETPIALAAQSPGLADVQAVFDAWQRRQSSEQSLGVSPGAGVTPSL